MKVSGSSINLFLRMRNMLDYPLRQWFRWQRSGFLLKKQPGGELYATLSGPERSRAEELAEDLKQSFHLESFFLDSSPVNYRENLFYLQMLAEALNRSGVCLPDTIEAADIGPSHWFYVQALYALLKWWKHPSGRVVTLQGYELDAFRIYNNFYSRADHARAHIRGLAGVDYIPRGFSTQAGRFDLITMLFPFVFERDHLEWGLPASIFHPDVLLQSAWNSLKPGGVLLIVNQGIEEHQAQKVRLQMLGIQPAAAFRQDPLLFHYSIDRYVLVCCREPAHG